MGRFTHPKAKLGLSMKVETKRFVNHLTKMYRKLSSAQMANALLHHGLDILTQIIDKNPVALKLGGRSRAGWYFGYQSMQAIVGGGPAKTASSAEEKEGFAKGSIKYNLSGEQKTIMITNAVEYVGALEYGWSKQAPYGMVRITMRMFRRALPKRILAGLRKMWDRDGVPHYTPWRATSDGPRANFK